MKPLQHISTRDKKDSVRHLYKCLLSLVEQDIFYDLIKVFNALIYVVRTRPLIARSWFICSPYLMGAAGDNVGAGGGEHLAATPETRGTHVLQERSTEGVITHIQLLRLHMSRKI